MNFVYTLGLFFSFLLMSVGLQITIGHKCGDLFPIMIALSGLVVIVTLITALFNNLDKREDAKKYFNRLRKYKKELKMVKDNMEAYKTELQASLTTLYPQYEKDVFKNMKPDDMSNLSAILVKYPELKFNNVLTDYTNGIKGFLATIASIKEKINDNIMWVENLQANGWYIGKLDMPQDIQNIRTEFSDK